jgi:transcriptional regulator with XRE-family HTH domain
MDTKDLLLAVRRAHDLPSFYKLARFLDVSEKTVWRWSSGRNTPDDSTAAKLAELAGLDADVVLANIQAQRSSDPEERARWQRIAQRLERSGLCIMSTAFWACGQWATAQTNSRAGALSPVTL